MKVHRIVRLAAGSVALLFLGLIYGWSIFRAPLVGIFPEWKATQVSWVFTISMIFFCLGGFVSGKLTTKIPHRHVLRIAALCILIGFSSITLLLDPSYPLASLVLLYIAYGVCCGGGVGLSYNSVLGCVTRHFPDKNGLCSGVLLLGFGTGGMALGSVVNAVQAAIGIRATFAVTGVIMAFILLPLSFFLKLPETKIVHDNQGKPVQSTDCPLSTVLHTPTFWFFSLWMISMSIGGLLVINSAANIAVFFGSSAVMGLVVSVFNGAGRAIMGYAFDKFGRKMSMYITALIMLIGGVLLCTGTASRSGLWIFTGFPLIGIAYGGTSSLTSASMLRFYGAKYYGVNFAAINFNLIPAAIIGPLVSSALQERSNGSYFSTFIMIIIAAALAFLLNIIVTVWASKNKLEIYWNARV